MGRTTYFPAMEILPGLWIGSEGDSKNPDFFHQNNIGFVVNCTRNIVSTTAHDLGVEVYQIKVDDAKDENDNMLYHWPLVVRIIDTVLRNERGVLVHCRAGMQRSAATVAAYLMYKKGLSASDAQKAIKNRKPETFWPTATFARALRDYEGKRDVADNALNVTALQSLVRTRKPNTFWASISSMAEP